MLLRQTIGALIVSATFMFQGCGGGGTGLDVDGNATVPSEQVPSLGSVSLSPNSLKFIGGQVTLSIPISNTRDITTVTAEVIKLPSLSGTKITLTEAGPGTNVWVGTYTFDPNNDISQPEPPAGRSVSYTVSASAVTSFNNTYTSLSTPVTVPAMVLPTTGSTKGIPATTDF